MPSRRRLSDYGKPWTEPVQVYADVISGSKSTRPALDALMQDIRCDKVRRILVFKLDRLGRSLSHFASIMQELKKHGVALHVPEQGIDTSSGNQATGWLQMNILMAVAEFERELIRSRVVAGLEAAKARGVKLGRKQEHNGTVAEVVELHRQGVAMREIGRRLNIPKTSVRNLIKNQLQKEAA